MSYGNELFRGRRVALWSGPNTLSMPRRREDQ